MLQVGRALGETDDYCYNITKGLVGRLQDAALVRLHQRDYFRRKRG
jgi:hypothetical protein